MDIDKSRPYHITKQVLICCLICQALTNISVMAVGACIAVDPRKADIKGHGFIMLILSVMFLCILAAGAVGTIGEYTCILILFACLMIVGFLVGGLTHLMVFLTSAPGSTLQRMEFSLKDYENEKIVRKMWDLTHEQGKCCGISGPDNWLSAKMTVPSSCCHDFEESKDPSSDHCVESNRGKYLYQKGCFKPVTNHDPLLKFQKQKNSDYKESVIYIMIFNYVTKIACIVAALTMAWYLW